MQQQLLRIDSSMRKNGSHSRTLTDALIAQLNTEQHYQITTRDLSNGISFVNEAWIYSNFTDPSERSLEQRSVLAESDSLVAELKNANTIVIGLPLYNFSVPAAFKAWIDLVARARETFHYTENGPKGLLEGKKAYVIIVSGGTSLGSEIDYASNYVRHVLGFIGIFDVSFIKGGELMVDEEQSLNNALAQISAL